MKNVLEDIGEFCIEDFFSYFVVDAGLTFDVQPVKTTFWIFLSYLLWE